MKVFVNGKCQCILTYITNISIYYSVILKLLTQKLIQMCLKLLYALCRKTLHSLFKIED